MFALLVQAVVIATPYQLSFDYDAMAADTAGSFERTLRCQLHVNLLIDGVCCIQYNLWRKTVNQQIGLVLQVFISKMKELHGRVKEIESQEQKRKSLHGQTWTPEFEQTTANCQSALNGLSRLRQSSGCGGEQLKCFSSC